MSNQWINDVEEFHTACGIDMPWEGPCNRALAEKRLGARLVIEELRETLEGLSVGNEPARERLSAAMDDLAAFMALLDDREVDLTAVADGVIDLLWVTIRLGMSFGLPLPDLWGEVARSNFRKVGPDGKVRRRPDGKILKPDDWQPPEIGRVIAVRTVGRQCSRCAFWGAPSCPVPGLTGSSIGCPQFDPAGGG